MENYPGAKPFADHSKGREDESALAMLVPAAEPLVRDFRASHDTSASEGMPAHVTVIWPFMHPDDLTDQTITRIRDILAHREPIAFSLGSIGQFNCEALYLRPEPAGPIKALIQAVSEAFPDYPPYRGEHGQSLVPHLTVAQVKSPEAFERAEADFRALSDGRLPIAVERAGVSLMERRQGLWRERRVFSWGLPVA